MSSDKLESLTSDLYDDSTIIFFYDKAPMTTKIGAWLPEKKYNLSKVKSEYLALEKIKGWRRMLDNRYTSPFMLDNKQWQTVEHYFYAHICIIIDGLKSKSYIRNIKFYFPTT